MGLFPTPLEDLMLTYVIPCAGAKLDTAAPARDLYVGQMFRHTLAAAEAAAAADGARVLILSARYGLVELDRVIDPYEQRMDKPGAIAAAELAYQAVALGVGRDVYALLPQPYFRRLDEALRILGIWLQDAYEASNGIGDQRHINSTSLAA